MRVYLAAAAGLGFALLGLASLVHAETQVPLETENTRVRFACSSGIVAVSGRFEAVQGRVGLEDTASNPNAVQVAIGSDSLTTGQAMIDRQLKGSAFFDSAHHPAIQFVSTSAIETGPGQAQVVGLLTLKNITRSVMLDVTLEAEPLEGSSLVSREEPIERRTIRASTQIRRSDFGMAGFESLISDACEIQILVALPERLPNAQR